MIAALVLAAGGSSRFGSPKALAPLRGRPLLQHAVDAVSALLPVTLVLGAEADTIRSRLIFDGQVIVNTEWREGLASSLRIGLESLCADHAQRPHAVLIALGDQPAVNRNDYRRLIDAWQAQRTAIVAARWDGVLGAPCIFPQTLFDSLRQLQGDRGARGLLQSLRDQVVAVDLEHARWDVDTPADLAEISRAD